MKTSIKVKCEECGRKCSNIYGPNLDLCRPCFNKGKFQTKIPNGPMIFDEEVSIHINYGSVSVTKEQGNKIEDRLKYLFPNKREDHRFSGFSKYLRLLILNDIDSQFHGKQKEVNNG